MDEMPTILNVERIFSCKSWRASSIRNIFAKKGYSIYTPISWQKQGTTVVPSPFVPKREHYPYLLAKKRGGIKTYRLTEKGTAPPPFVQNKRAVPLSLGQKRVHLSFVPKRVLYLYRLPKTKYSTAIVWQKKGTTHTPIVARVFVLWGKDEDFTTLGVNVRDN